MKKMKLGPEPDWIARRRDGRWPWHWDTGIRDFNMSYKINGVAVLGVSLIQMDIGVRGWRCAQAAPRQSNHHWPRDLLYRRHAP